MANDDKWGKPPEQIADYDMGRGRDAIASDDDTYTKWVADHEREVKWAFELRERVPVRKKGQILERNTSTDEEGLHVAYDYYVDMLEYMIVSWSGESDPEAPGLRELLTGAYTGSEPDNPVFESLQDEVPPPFANVSEADLNV
jgi:hypothetical protein